MPWKRILLEGDAAVLSDTAPVNVDYGAASAGVATQAARQDHKHDVPEAVLADLARSDFMSGAIGTLDKFVRADHRHTLTRGVSGELKAVDASAASIGSSSGLISVDHVHALGPMAGPTNFSGYELRGLRLQQVASGPDTANMGLMVFLSGDLHPYVYTS